MVPTTDQIEQRTEQLSQGILRYVNDFLDKRFAQARRISPKLAGAEGDLRWHQMETLHLVLRGKKSFGPVRIAVADILCGEDDSQRRRVFYPTDQASIISEIVPSQEKNQKERRPGQLDVNDVRSYYKALDPSLEKVIELIQSWIWWDLPDAVNLFRFDLHQRRVEALRRHEMDAHTQQVYAEQMGRAGQAVTREEALQHELKRLKEILDAMDHRLAAEEGYQMIVVHTEHEGSAEADATCQRLAKRLRAMEKVRQQPGEIDEAVREYYGQQLGIPADAVTPEDILEMEGRESRLDRQRLADQLGAGRTSGESHNYKRVRVQETHRRFEALLKEMGVTIAEKEKPAETTAGATNG